MDIILSGGPLHGRRVTVSDDTTRMRVIPQWDKDRPAKDYEIGVYEMATGWTYRVERTTNTIIVI